MKQIFLISTFLLLTFTVSTQTIFEGKVNDKYPVRKLTIEPAIGVETMSDVIISNLIQLNLKKRLSILSYTSYAYNNAMQRDFGFIKTDYNYSISQKFGIGTSLYTKRASHTFSLIAGLRFDGYKETLDYPEIGKISASVSSVSPDAGLMYNLKMGKKKYFFSYRMYIPLYPYPVKSTDIWSLGDNLSNLSFEFGLGMKLK